MVFLEFEKPLEEINQKISELRRLSEQSGIDLKDEIKKMEDRSKLLKIKIMKATISESVYKKIYSL